MEVIAGIDADIAAVSIVGEVVAEVVAAFTKPAVNPPDRWETRLATPMGRKRYWCLESCSLEMSR